MFLRTVTIFHKWFVVLNKCLKYKKEYFPFSSFSNQGTLYVQKGLIDAFKASEDWNCWKNILPIENYDPALGIAQAETNREKSGIIYDLQGRKVETPQAGGLYMKNGKKFIYRP
jgi:hypothetical protein